ncbi:hypothetical protein PENSPDRAFT_694041 [Peniophora sp. CONT]|nr:hypothetical protein PENSPDRAFT_694041 [Peniophora sp. CONT]
MAELDRELPLDITRDPSLAVTIDPLRRGVKQYAVLYGWEIGIMDQLDATLATFGISGARVVKMNSYAAAHRRFRLELGKGNSVGIIGLDSAETREVYIEALRSALTRPSTPCSQSFSTPSRLPSPISPSWSSASFNDLGIGGLSLSPTPLDNVLPWSEQMRRKPRFAPEGWNPPNGYTPPESRGIGYRPPANLIFVDASTDPKSTHAWYVAYKSRQPGIFKTWRAAAEASPGFRPLTNGFSTYAAALRKWVDLRESGDVTVVVQVQGQ